MSEFTVEAADARRALSTALGFASTSTYDPPVICSVNLMPVDGGIEFAATDRYVLFWEPVEITGEAFRALLPVDIARRLLSLMPRGTSRKPVTGMVSFKQDGDRITITYVGDFDTTLTFTPDDAGHFPDYHAIFDKATAAEGEPVAPAIHFSPHLVTRVTRAIASRGSNGTPLKMAFNSPTKPLVISHESFTALIMPVRMAS